jgi:peptide/nickel transport system substrate-binding protein
MKRTISVITILLALGLIFTACGPAATTAAPATSQPKPTAAAPATPAPTAAAVPTEFPRNETLYVSGSAWGPASTWNPFQPGSLANTTGTLGLVYETLFDFNPTSGELTGHLAESGVWTNDNTFDVTLRNGLTWSDGQAVTAADVKYTYELAKTYSALWFSSEWTNVGLQEVAAVDDTHVKFTCKDCLYQQFSNDLYNIPIVPQHLWKDRSEEDITTGANNNPVGSGAYLYLSNAEDRNIWQRNDNWWGISVFGKPAPKYIVDIRTSSNNVALGMVLKGELDLSNNFLPGVAELVDKGYVSTYYPKAPYMLSANTAVLFLNTTKAPMDDAKFRRALAFAIDVPGIVGVAYADLVAASSPTGLLPALDAKFGDAATKASLGYSFDTKNAKSMLAAAGYKDVDGDGFVETPAGDKIELEVTCPQGWTDWMAAIDIIASSAQAAGINIKSAYPDYGAWNTDLQGATFDMTLNNWAGLSNTPWTLYNLLFSHPLRDQMQSGNFGKYDNQAAFDAVDALAKIPVTDIAGMQAACKDIQTILLTDMPMIPLWYNGMWAQFSTATWTNWPTDGGSNPGLPITWSGYWQMGGLTTLINIKPAAAS